MSILTKWPPVTVAVKNDAGDEVDDDVGGAGVFSQFMPADDRAMPVIPRPATTTTATFRRLSVVEISSCWGFLSVVSYVEILISEHNTSIQRSSSSSKQISASTNLTINLNTYICGINENKKQTNRKKEKNRQNIVFVARCSKFLLKFFPPYQKCLCLEQWLPKIFYKSNIIFVEFLRVSSSKYLDLSSWFKKSGSD